MIYNLSYCSLSLRNCFKSHEIFICFKNSSKSSKSSHRFDTLMNSLNKS